MKKVLFILLAITTISCSKGAETIPPTYKYISSTDEIEMLNTINHYRDSLGKQPVTLVEHVSFKCEEHNEYMIINNIINHDYFYDRSENIKQVCHAMHVGEIIAYNYNTCKSTVNAWMNSPCHDTILRSDFKRIGISIRENTQHQKYYTVIFID
jgi:uncharacterized protein YkwD